MAALSSLQPGEKVTADDPRLFNMGDLAAILGVTRFDIRRLKNFGFKMPLGRATVAMAHQFLRENADMLSPAPREKPILKKKAKKQAVAK
jgi:hypothetical protein